MEPTDALSLFTLRALYLSLRQNSGMPWLTLPTQLTSLRITWLSLHLSISGVYWHPEFLSVSRRSFYSGCLSQAKKRRCCFSCYMYLDGLTLWLVLLWLCRHHVLHLWSPKSIFLSFIALPSPSDHNASFVTNHHWKQLLDLEVPPHSSFKILYSVLKHGFIYQNKCLVCSWMLLTHTHTPLTTKLLNVPWKKKSKNKKKVK